MSASLACISWKLPIGRPNWLALMHVRQHDIEAGAHDAERSARQHHALVVESAHQDLRAVALFVQQVRRGHLAVVEHELARIRAAHAELVELLRSRRILACRVSTMKAVMPRAPELRVERRVDDQHVGARAVRDPHLVAVQHVVVAASARRACACP